MHAAQAPRVLIFHSCAIFCLFFTHFIKGFWPFLCNFGHFLLIFTILGIFANFTQLWAFIAHILCAKFSQSKFCVCYFVSFFHLYPESGIFFTKLANNFKATLIMHPQWQSATGSALLFVVHLCEGEGCYGYYYLGYYI